MGEIGSELGDLLWRRAYEAHANGSNVVHVLPKTLESLLRQAGVDEPEDDVVFGPQGVLHGRTMEAAWS